MTPTAEKAETVPQERNTSGRYTFRECGCIPIPHGYFYSPSGERASDTFSSKGVALEHIRMWTSDGSIPPEQRAALEEDIELSDLPEMGVIPFQELLPLLLTAMVDTAVMSVEELSGPTPKGSFDFVLVDGEDGLPRGCFSYNGAMLSFISAATKSEALDELTLGIEAGAIHPEDEARIRAQIENSNLPD